MDVIRVIEAVCSEMADVLTEEQLNKLEISLYNNASKFTQSTALVKSDINNDLQLVKSFVASKKLAGRASSTLEAYTLELWTMRKMISKSFVDINTLDVKSYLAMMQMRGLMPTTLNNKRLYLNSFFEFLYEEGVRSDNPVKRIEPFISPKRRKDAYSIADIESLRQGCECIRDRAIIEFFLATGLRVSEVTQLKVKDLDMRNKKIVVIGKGNKERIVFYNEMAEFYLHKYLNWRLRHEYIDEDTLMEEYLFVSNKAPYKKLDNNGVRSLMKKLGKLSNVNNVHPHRFRRTFATTAINRQMPIEKVRGILGHEKIETTLLYIDDRNDLEHTYKMYMV
jgi:site-specific recombinase XerD